jgi:uncharacterized OsmC-like protein
VTRFASREGIKLDGVEVELGARFAVGEKYGVDHEGSAMQGLTYVLDIKSSAPREAIQRVAALGERFCHASASLKVVVPVEPSLRLNGETLPFDESAANDPA